MPDILSEMASKTGLNLDVVKQALASLMASLKGAIPENSFTKLSEAVPEADQLADEGKAAEGGGLMGMVGKMLGGNAGGLAALAGKLSSLGLTTEQVTKFFTNFVAFIKDKVPADVLKQIMGMLPGAAEAK